MQLAPRAAQQQWLTLRHLPIATALVAPDGRFLAANDAFHGLLGYDDESLPSLTFRAITHPDDLAADVQLARETLDGTRSSYRLSKRCVHADGHPVWVDLSVSLMRDDDGSPLHLIAQILDVTDQLSAPQQLALAQATIDQQRRRTEAVYDTVDVGLVLLDAEGEYQTVNQRHHAFLDLAYPSGHHGRAGQLGEVYAEDGVTALGTDEVPSIRAVRGEEFDDLRMWIGGDPATRRALSVSARSVRDETGGFAGAVLAYKDVTDYLNAASVKDEFVASVSHELRTPMTSILGHLEILAEDPCLPPEVIDRVKTVERNALRLRRLVTDLLEIQRDSVGGLQLTVAECDLSQIVRDSIAAAIPWARSASISLEGSVPDSLVLRADPERLRQVVDNLISNAIKYNVPGGTVAVTLTCPGDAAEIVVADTGIGIPEEDLPRLFTRFHRGKVAREQQIQGTGLGLNIIRAIVEKHGGTTVLTSEPGQGTRATVCLPRGLVA